VLEKKLLAQDLLAQDLLAQDLLAEALVREALFGEENTELVRRAGRLGSVPNSFQALPAEQVVSDPSEVQTLFWTAGPEPVRDSTESGRLPLALANARKSAGMGSPS
jgi:hypothetical protein